MNIKDLTKETNNIELVVLADKVTQGTASNGSTYLSITLKDRTGTIEARLWDARPADIECWIKGNCYKVNINIIEYRKVLQAKINTYDIIDNDSINLEDFIEVAPLPPDVMYDEIITTVQAMQTTEYREIMTLILSKYGEQFKIWPAAVRNHHEIKSGLIWHSLTMLKMAKNVANVYSDRLIDAELLYCGVILHDLGKVIEITSGATNDFSLEGKLIGHISIMANELNHMAKINDLNSEKIILLEHMILASHGRLEYGSPVEPHLLEAEILSFLDNLDARIYRIDKELKKTSVNEQTQRLLAVEGRWFLKHFEK
ncbi:MAG: HD domain-containing protein [Spiroplasma poulsonii]|uniref:3'-5' exoribonuclease YhaM n=1 Tax=Spiroplasma poulsonii TaxID=2138 RepID=A0A2P6FBI0_9MOLU|nr:MULTISPECIES: HD domain-containing protein [Spiroplasma]KAF0851230.1 3'-5' exoribonuclease YhaM [Spiroplasma poulsonii]MBH8622351.1 HD domain-containing protein [Spiroplasma sp. hyd1]MBW1242187.1 HD domain-containing protein [Spiroplasma poulsonii]PQM30825.1 3'-5' exoribonuclease YhaM [Spiroplasma poulsonii]PWF95815.1 3'-5' exoribonuclease YhaM [Spiroplasma poulsonii]